MKSINSNNDEYDLSITKNGVRNLANKLSKLRKDSLKSSNTLVEYTKVNGSLFIDSL